MEIKSLTITQYLIQGDSDGLIATYVSNWNGQCLKFPRNLLSKAKVRPEFARPGIYFLIGKDLSEINNWKIYIGESEDLYSRVGIHARDISKDFWEQGVIFSSKDDNLTKSHIRYLESRMIKELRGKNNIKLENLNNAMPNLPEASKSEMETYIDFLKLIMPVLGFPFFDQNNSGALGVEKRPFHLKVKDISAIGLLTPKGIIVKKGNLVSQTVSDPNTSYSVLRHNLIKQNIIKWKIDHSSLITNSIAHQQLGL